jgi:DNA-binding transcriptional regulator of glucitol operon
MDNNQEQINENAIFVTVRKFGKFAITAIVQYIINNPHMIREFTDKMMANDDPKVQRELQKQRDKNKPYGYREL